MKFFNFNHKNYRVNEYIVMVYRFVLVMIMYSIGRIIFYLFNTNLFPNIDLNSFLYIMRGGVMFDTSAVLYLNLIYFIFFILPFPFKFNDRYQKVLKWIFMVFNGIGLAFNHIDIIFYRFILKRTTAGVFDIFSHDERNYKLIFRFLDDFWYIFLIWLLTIFALSWLYSLLKPQPTIKKVKSWRYSLVSLVAMVIVALLSVIGMRGGYMPSTRPINMNNAGKYVNTVHDMSLVTNTPFCIIRTWGKKGFKVMDYYKSEEEINKVYTPVRKPLNNGEMKKNNVVVFILESFSREFIGSLNKELNEGKYKGYAPFMDSLITQSLVFPNAFANGRKSIDAIPSVTSSIPALVLPYVISERSGNKINSLASILNKEGYETSFFHGAPNGSMGFDAFTKIAGYQKYYGKNEYNDDSGFDGVWGIWDELFFQFFADQMSTMKEPFMTTIFSVSSHHPFEVPEKYKKVFVDEHLPLQKCIRYTDFALKQFFAKAAKMPWFKNTLFVLTADHCSESDFDSYQTSVMEHAVPLIFFRGDLSLKGVDNSLAQQIDIMPSILGYLNYSKPYVAFGNNLFDPATPRFVMNYPDDAYQFLRGDLVYYFAEGQVKAVFNRKNDPFLLKNLLGSDGTPEDQQLIKAFIQQFNNRMAQDRLTIENP